MRCWTRYAEHDMQWRMLQRRWARLMDRPPKKRVVRYHDCTFRASRAYLVYFQQPRRGAKNPELWVSARWDLRYGVALVRRASLFMPLGDPDRIHSKDPCARFRPRSSIFAPTVMECVLLWWRCVLSALPTLFPAPKKGLCSAVSACDAQRKALKYRP